MGQTMVEKILSDHCVSGEAEPGKYIECRIDMLMGNDLSAPVAIQVFRDLGVERVFDPERIALVPDHFVPNKDIISAQQCKVIREFAREQGIEHFFEVGEMGIEHVILPELGLVSPGEVIIGADSHTVTYGALGAFATGVGSTDLAAAFAKGSTWLKVPETYNIVLSGKPGQWVSGKDIILFLIGCLGVDGATYKSLEFTGTALPYLTMADRFTICNMVVECGAKCGFFPVDDITKAYTDGRCRRPAVIYKSDVACAYEKTIEIDVGAIEPQVAFPHLPDNTRSMSEVLAGEAVTIDQVVIGSCTNGRIEDLRQAADIIRGKRVHNGVRLIVLPGSQQIYLQALNEGLVRTFIEAGAVFSTPTCGPCIGGHMGLLASGERAISTTNRNFVGRMGHKDSELYLAGPAVAAASAILGRIAFPQEVN